MWCVILSLVVGYFSVIIGLNPDIDIIWFILSMYVTILLFGLAIYCLI